MSDGVASGGLAERLATARLLQHGLEELRIETDEKQREQLTELALLLARWAPRINLTGHRGPVEIARRLILDACGLASVLPEIRAADGLADLGSGAGFPGLPLAILHPQLEVTLIESRARRVHFQREARRQLGLTRVVPLLGRAEELPVVPQDIVVAQAMTRPARAVELMMRWCRRGGLLVLPASEGSPAPIVPRGTSELESRRYRVPGSEIERRLWVVTTERD